MYLKEILINNKTMKRTGFIIIFIGLFFTAFSAFKFFTKEKVVDLGSIEISRDKPHYLSWSPMIGLVLIGIGGVVLWQGSKR